MADESGQVLWMDSNIDSGMAEIIVRSNASVPMRVEYELSVEGNNRTHHKGATTVMPGEGHILSRVRVSNNSAWCATLDVKQDDGLQYRLSEGGCGD